MGFLLLVGPSFWFWWGVLGGDTFFFRKCANKAQIALRWSLGITKDAELG